MYNPSLHRNNFHNTKFNNSHVFTLQKIKILKCHKFSNVVKLWYSFQMYKTMYLSNHVTPHLFKIIDTLKAENIKLNKNYLWDTLEIYWKEVAVTFNGNKIELPRVVIIKLKDKIKIRRLVNRDHLLLHLMLKQGVMWFTLATETQETT